MNLKNGKYTFLRTCSYSYFDPKDSYGYTILKYFSAMAVESTEEQFSGPLYLVIKVLYSYSIL